MGFAVSDIRGQTSGPSTNLSDHSRITSSNTEHSSSFIRSLSSAHSRNSPITNEKRTLSEKSSCDNSRPSADSQPTTDTVVHQQHRERLRRTNLDATDEQINGHRPSRGIKTVQVEKHVPYSSDIENHGAYGSQIDKRESYRSPSTETAEIRRNRFAERSPRQMNRFFDGEKLKSGGAGGLSSRMNELGIESRRMSDINEVAESGASERTIPIKITPEAKKILERNAQMFPRNSVIEQEESQVLFSESFYF